MLSTQIRLCPSVSMTVTLPNTGLASAPRAWTAGPRFSSPQPTATPAASASTATTAALLFFITGSSGKGVEMRRPV